MQFTDPAQVQARTHAVLALLPATSNPTLTHSETRLQTQPADCGTATFDALAGTITWDDTDGQERSIALPDGTTSEAIAGMLFVLAEAQDWS